MSIHEAPPAGLDLHVTAHGPADAPVTVLLAHCWTADEADWHYQVRDLLAHFGPRIRLVTWDHRGHGRSPAAAETDCTVENLARDMGRVVDAHAPTGALVLAGHSIGGMTIMALPEVRPDLVGRVAGLALVATSSGGLETVTLGLPELGTVLRGRIPMVLATRARMLSRSKRRRSPSIERWVVTRFLFGRGSRLRDTGLVVDQLVSCAPATMSGYYRDCLRHERTAALRAWDDVPTVVMVGSSDVLTPPAHARRIAAGVRGARLLVAPGAGHMLPLERDTLVSDELIGLVEGALATTSATATSAGGGRATD